MCGGNKGQSTSKQQSNTQSSYTPAALGDIQQIFNRANTASQIPYVPYPGALIAGFDPEQVAAQNNINMSPYMAQPYIGASAGLFGEAAQNPNTNGLIQSFYNPMASNVMANLQDVFGQQMSQTTGQLQQAAGGVGADRVAIGQSELARQQGLAAGQTMAQLYGQAQQAAAGQQGLEQASAFGFGQLGPAAEQALLSGANAQLGVGTLGQQTQQNLLNAQYQQFLRQQGYPFQTAGFLGSVGLPAATAQGGTGTGQISGTTQYTPAQPNPFAQGIGLGVGLLGMLAKGGRIKRDTGGLIPFNPNNETEFNVNGYVPQSQPSQGQSYNPMAMAPQMMGMGLMGSNSMVGGNPMTGSAGAYSNQNNPLTMAKSLRDEYKQGQEAKGGLHDLVDKAAANGWLSSDEAGDLGEAGLSGWDTTTTVGGDDTAARGGRFASGGSPWFGQALSNMQANAKTDPLNNATTPEEMLFRDMIQQQEQGGSGGAGPSFFSGQHSGGPGDPWGSRLGMMSPMGQELNDLAVLEKQGAQTGTSGGASSDTAGKTGPAPFVPSQASVDIGNPTQSGMSPFMGMMPFIPQVNGGSNKSTFDPTAGGTLGATPNWAQGPLATNPGMAPQWSAPQAMVANGGAIRGYENGGPPDDYDAGELMPEDLAPFREDIGSIETGGQRDPYTTVGPMSRHGDMPYGKYQVMGANVGPWTKEALGREMSPQEFLRDRNAQDTVFNSRFGSYLDKYSNPEDAASMWFSGHPLAGNQRSDTLGTTVPGYVKKFDTALNGNQQPMALSPPTKDDQQPTDIPPSGSRSLQTDAEMAQILRQMRENAAPITTPWGVTLTPGRLALMQAGFGMAASGSPFFGQAVGQGLSSGMSELNQARQLQSQLMNPILAQTVAMRRLGQEDERIQQGQGRLDMDRLDRPSRELDRIYTDEYEGRIPHDIAEQRRNAIYQQYPNLRGYGSSQIPGQQPTATPTGNSITAPTPSVAPRLSMDPDIPDDLTRPNLPMAQLNKQATKERADAEVQYSGAQQQRQWLANMIRESKTLQSGWMTTGAGSEQRTNIARSLNTFSRMMGMPPVISNEQEADAAAIQKGTNQLTTAMLTSAFGHQREAGFWMNKVQSLLPNIDQSPATFREVTANMLAAADYIQGYNKFKMAAIDKNGFVPTNTEDRYLELKPMSLQQERQKEYVMAQEALDSGRATPEATKAIAKKLKEEGIDPTSLGISNGQ